MANTKQIVKEIKKSLDKLQLEKAISLSENEAQTRMYLIEPFFEMLLFNRTGLDGTLFPEYTADFADLKGKKVDYAILLNGKRPDIVVEAKKAGLKLNENHLRQLNEYFMYTSDAKIGILTNGIQYEFYTRNSNSKTSLNPKPFFVFNLEDYDSSSLEMLAMFYRTEINIKAIIEEAEDVFFLDRFEDAFYKELADPSKDFIKAVYGRMGGQRLTPQLEISIKQLINAVSIKDALEKLIEKEARSANTGVITTEEELKFFHIIKTVIAHHKSIETNRVGYRDMKGKFTILLDDNQKKKICDLFVSANSSKLEIDGDKFDIPDIDSILKLKKKLTDKALTLID